MKNSFRLRNRKGTRAEAAEKLAPPEEKKANEDEGPIRVTKVKISPDLIEDNGQARWFHVDPIVAAILIGAICFILFIASQIHQGPAQY